MLFSEVPAWNSYGGTSGLVSDPRALRAANQLLQSSGCTFRAVHADKFTYHPKLYLFECANSIDVLIGSANLTGTGLGNRQLANCEASVHLQVAPDASFRAQIQAFRDTVRSWPVYDLEIYERNHKKIARNRLKISEAIDELHSYPKQPVEDEQFDAWLSAFRADSKRSEDIQKRREDLQAANKIVDWFLANPGISDQAFAKEYVRLVGGEGQGESRYWRPNGLYRRKNEVIRNGDKFIKLLENLKRNLSMSAGEPVQDRITRGSRQRGGTKYSHLCLEHVG